jgi:tRNA pseudouridine55 synthase
VSVLSVYKPLGATPLQALDALRVERPEFAHEPMTYAGRLDPMAEGLLVVLTGEDRYRAKEFQQLDKTYRATFVLGFGSDTGDVLGMVTDKTDGDGFDGYMNNSSCHPEGVTRQTEGSLVEAVRALCGDHDVLMPVYSSYKVKGKPLHVWARSGRLHEIEVPRRVMQVDAVRNVEVGTMSADVFLKSVIEGIGKVSGDFRQEEIVARWNEIMRGVNELTLVSCELDVQSGTYIRSLAGVLVEQLQTKTILYRLVRTKVGDFSLL